jgi:hypothetical protein
MEPVSEALRLVKRQAEIEPRRRQLGGTTILEERELFAIRARLEDFPVAGHATVELTGARRQPVGQIRVEDVEPWDVRG